MTTETTYPRLTDTQDVIDACAARPDVQPFARVVGAWVWCEFPDKPSAETREFLKQTGFRWNRERSAWQHPCGIFRRKNRHADPRSYYGQRPIDGTDETPRYGDRPSNVQASLNTFQAI